MKIPTRPVLVMHGSPTLRDGIRAAVDSVHTVQAFPDWASLSKAIADAPPSAVVVVDPYAGGGAGSSETIPRALYALLADFPSVPVFAALDVTPGRTEDLVRMGEAGVADVIALGHDDTPEALLGRFRRAEGRPLKALLDRALPLETGSRARAVLDAAAEVVSAGGVGHDLARSLGLSPRTLLRRVDRLALPAPRQLLAWMRILLAAELLDDRGRTVAGVALACGYSSDASLRRVLTRFVGSSPAQLRRRGAFAAASAAFVAELDRLRTRRQE